MQCTVFVGEVQNDQGRNFLRQPGERFFEDSNNLQYFLYPDNEELVLEDDEDELVLAGLILVGCGRGISAVAGVEP